jgi:hypothetical protein
VGPLSVGVDCSADPQLPLQSIQTATNRIHRFLQLLRLLLHPQQLALQFLQ